ncbi:bestrophin-3 [Loa loa]|uniref:Bestrophin homolog n=1 Tax=Loa loa TaxID=7209 RepID=A0A1S0UGX1_LOALO|nr:bestrophin-3 [Loa loa]EJD74825.1 bestrophin-3 [Loa loa]
MTVQYNLDVSTSRPWTLFKLLFRWRGSIWKSITLELFVWLILFAVISLIYRVALTNEQISKFEQFVHYCDEKLDYIPLNFMLGFFVTIVLSRWNNFFVNIGYIDNIALMVAAYVKGTDDRARMLRRNIIRYCVLSQALVFRDISMRVRKRFPTVEALVAAGFMMKHEKEKYDAIQYRYAKYWMPFQWALSLCQEARNQQKISSDILLEKVGEEIKIFRTNLAILCNFDWVPLPIMYPQLIVLAVHTYFLVGAIARQYIISDNARNKSAMDIYLPVMTIIQFIFYMGWLKVAEAMLNPFGEDDDDFECNFLLDKNLSVGLTIVDDGCSRTPALLKDVFWSETEIEPLYSAESARGEYRLSGLTGSTANVRLTDQKSKIKMLPLSRELDNHYSISGLLRSSVRHSLRGGRTDLHSGIMNIVRQKFARSLSHTHFNTSQNGDECGSKTNQNVDELSGLEKGCSKRMSNSESRRSSLNRVLETIINESYDNPNVNLSDEDLPLTLKHIPVSIAGDGRHSGHLTLSQTSMLHKLEDLVEETEESMSRKNTIEESDINNIKLRNNDVQIENFDGLLSSILTRRRSVPSNLVNYDNVQMTLRRQKSYPKLT